MSAPKNGIEDLVEHTLAPGNISAPPQRQAEPDAAPASRLRVTVVWGDLPQVRADLHVTGHYQGIAPTAAERALDRTISAGERQVIAEHNRRGWIDAKLGKVSYFPCQAGDSVHSAAVVGMGRMGTFTERRATRLYESLLSELLALGHVGKAATVLIGSGAENLPVKHAARALIRGFVAALKAAALPTLTEVLIVEIDRLRAEKLRRALRVSGDALRYLDVADEVTEAAGGRVKRTSAAAYAVAELVRLAGAVAALEKGEGGPDAASDGLALRAVLAGIPNDRLRDEVSRTLFDLGHVDPTDITISTHISSGPQDSLPVNFSVLKGEQSLRWTALAERATLPERNVPVDGDLLRQLADRLTEPTVTDARELPHLLSRLVVPTEFQWLVSDEAPVVLEVDQSTAIVPWEFLADIQPDVGSGQIPLAVRTPISRILRTEYSAAEIVDVAEELRGGPPQALVIGDPGDPAKGMSLAKAQAEARTVKNVLRRNNVSVQALIGAPNYELREPDERPASRIDVLRALLSGRYHIVHYCGHGTFNEAGPSGWVFSDGLLTARELAQLARPPRIVVANACYSAKVKPSAAGALNVADEFLRAGVLHYIGAAWQVPDEEAQIFADVLYQELFGGTQTVGDAVQIARRKTYEAAPPDHHRWNAWAAYQHYGDPTDRIRGPVLP
ncbi:MULTISPECIES: CHAT domain-containing protein [unclassified Streptomyces]|uniref:CHAT domain-containing protein n=1 Tax=unclassified Streptomyces TaxID=2593676 RepID=UPI0008909DF5|nr:MULTISPECIES: CHAT domain-containing protein [unclassified Streptomyces]PBC85956.1 CHAT domain-containing protein [Streptomyces sp. 2321.6]SDR01113.1 CHAT domain-containing protein [Streptomyces sp. KS_16]SED84017.1 CHAT domain-containing protein [Streptomyces sp. 2133.1]SNC72837.1 CHAT domain-containing protein [Streptomyces sp. 2114.4]